MIFKLYILILLSDNPTVDNLKTIYYLAQCEEVSITCAIIRYETGHLQCHKKRIICSLDYNNLFGFRYKKQYLRFSTYSGSVLYYQRWQKRHWTKYHKRYPKKSYYDFLKWIGYCNSMKDYIKVIKQLEKR